MSAIPWISPRAPRVRVMVRSLSSAAALSVKVNATMLRGSRESLRPGVSKCATRRATTSVFPDPAQAMSWRFRPSCSTARRCASVRSRRAPVDAPDRTARGTVSYGAPWKMGPCDRPSRARLSSPPGSMSAGRSALLSRTSCPGRAQDERSHVVEKFPVPVHDGSRANTVHASPSETRWVDSRAAPGGRDRCPPRGSRGASRPPALEPPRPPATDGRWRGPRSAPERSGRGDPGAYPARNRRIPNVSPAVASTVPTIHRMSLVSRLAISVRTSLI